MIRPVSDGKESNANENTNEQPEVGQASAR